MADMDLETTVNPLYLSLDEVIALNKFRNQEAQLASASTSEVKETPFNGHTDEVIGTKIQNKWSQDAPNRKGVFKRLGNIKPNYSNGHKTMTQHQALRAIRNAQQFKNQAAVRSVRNFGPSQMRTPLTTNVLRRHNQAVGNFTVRRRIGPGSVFSMSTQSVRPTTFRHSLKKSLDPQIQKLIQDMINGKPMTVQSVNGPMRVNHLPMTQFRIKSDSTSIPTHVRFTMNDEN